MYATKIKMKPGCSNSNTLTEIDEIHISGSPLSGYYKKAYLHDYLILHPASIQVNIPPYPTLTPATSIYAEKYVRSEPNTTAKDNLLSLPRE